MRDTAATLALTLAGGEVIETTSEHPFYVEGYGFQRAGEIGIGTSIVTRAGPSVQVLARHEKLQASTVYNLEVEEFHTYFVGNAKLWVHNIACPVLSAPTTVSRSGREFHLDQGDPKYGREHIWNAM